MARQLVSDNGVSGASVGVQFEDTSREYRTNNASDPSLVLPAVEAIHHDCRRNSQRVNKLQLS